jgi:hypothetical protein
MVAHRRKMNNQEKDEEIKMKNLVFFFCLYHWKNFNVISAQKKIESICGVCLEMKFCER